MARKPDPKPRELPLDIVAGHIAGLMQRRRITPLEICKLLGYAQTRTWNTRMSDPSSFTGADLNMICSFFGVTLEQLAHDSMETAVR